MDNEGIVSRYLAFLADKYDWKGDFCEGCNVLYPIDELHKVEAGEEKREVLECAACPQRRNAASREQQCLRRMEFFVKSTVSRYLVILADKFHWKGDFCAGCNILYPIDELDSTAHQGVLCCSLCAQQRPFRPCEQVIGLLLSRQNQCLAEFSCEQKVIGLLLSRQEQCLAEFPWDTWVCPTCRGVELVSSNGERMCVSRCYTKSLE